MRRFFKILLITIATFALVLLGVGGWQYHSKSKALLRRDELLKDFVQTSDDFTLPKVYRHKNFQKYSDDSFVLSNSKSNDSEVMHIFRNTSVDSHGNLLFGYSYSHDWALDVNVDDVIHEGIKGHLEDERIKQRLSDEKLMELAEHLTSKEADSIGKLRCRIRGNFISKNPRTDLTLEGEDKEAFIRTIELTDIFRRIQ
jgi:hypothetical protein